MYIPIDNNLNSGTIYSSMNKEGHMSKKLLNLADSLRGKSRDLETEISRLVLIVLSDRNEGHLSYDKKRVRKKIEDQKLNLSWGIHSFSQLEEMEIKSLYEEFSELELGEIRQFISEKFLNDRFSQFQGITSKAFDEVIKKAENSIPLVFIFADSILSHYEKINERSKVKLFFQNSGCLPLANILFESKVQLITYENIEEVFSKDSTLIHLGPFSSKPDFEKKHSIMFPHSMQESEIYELIRLNGKSNIIALLPISVSFSYQSRQFREYVNSSDRIKSLAELSSKALQFSHIQTIILEIGPSKDDKKIKIKAKDKDGISISKEQFYSNEDWNLSRHYSTGYKLEKESIDFGSILVDSFRGPALKKSDKGEKVFVVQNKDLKESDTIKGEDIQFDLYEYRGSLDRYYLQENDILLVCRGYSFSSAIIQDLNGKKIVASSNILVLRLDQEKASPNFVNMFLASPLGKIELESRQVGTAQIVLSVKDIKSIILPLLSIEEQKKLESDYFQAKASKEAAIERAKNQYETLLQALYSTMGIIKEN